MFLPLSKCIICHEQISKVKYNLKSTHSEKSNVLMIKLVEKLYENIVFLHCNICSSCYDLLNELDSIQQREKQLYEQLKQYFSKLDIAGAKTSKTIMSDTEEDRAILPQYHSSVLDEEGSSHSDDTLQIGDIDLKKLPIKVTRIKTRKDVTTCEESPRENSRQQSKTNDKAFEQIRSMIQMDLSKHIEEHMTKCKPSTNILCEICGQNLKTKLGYENHLKKHDAIGDDLKLLALNKIDDNCFCAVCGKNFNQKGALARHLPIHTGESRYQCEECGKKFLHHSSFNIHRKIHAGQRNFLCEFCNHGFLTNSHLKRHVRACHQKERNHHCPFCHHKFTENYNLVAHIKVVHKQTDDVPKDDTNIIYQFNNDGLVEEQETVIQLQETSEGFCTVSEKLLT